MINKFEFIVYVWISVSLYRLHLDWCQFISSTFGFVSVYIIYVWVVSVYFIYIWIGVSLNCLRLHLVSVDTIYVWSSVSLQCLLLHWCQFISSMIGFASVCIAYIRSGVSLYHLRVGVVSVYIIYVLGWCQSISSTFGIV